MINYHFDFDSFYNGFDAQKIIAEHKFVVWLAFKSKAKEIQAYLSCAWFWCSRKNAQIGTHGLIWDS